MKHIIKINNPDTIKWIENKAIVAKTVIVYNRAKRLIDCKNDYYSLGIMRKFWHRFILSMFEGIYNETFKSKWMKYQSEIYYNSYHNLIYEQYCNAVINKLKLGQKSLTLNLEMCYAIGIKWFWDKTTKINIK